MASGYTTRSRTLPPRMTQQERAEMEPYPEDVERPRHRGDCENAPRPCPFVSCRYHLYLDLSSGGNLKLTYPNLEVWELGQTCALDVADNNGEGLPLEEVGVLLNVTRERVRQLESSALAKVRERSSPPTEEEEA